MNTTLDIQLMPAQHTTDTAHTTGTPRREVKSVAIFESRRGRVKRAWDELSEVDRAIIMEAARQRRELQRHKQQLYTQVYGIGRLR